MKISVILTMTCVILLALISEVTAQAPPRAPVDDAPMALVPAPAFEPAVAPPTVAPRAVGGTDESGLPRVRVSSVEGSRIVGEVDDTEKLKLKTAFGEVEVAIAKIDNLTWLSGQKKVRVILSSGDNISGEPSDVSFKLKTVFGDLPIKLADLESFERGELVEVRVGESHLGRDGRTISTTFRVRNVFRPRHPSAPATTGVPSTPNYSWSPGPPAVTPAPHRTTVFPNVQ